MSQKFQELLKQHNRIYKTRTSFSSELEVIINKISEETGLHKKTIHSIVAAQFMMVRDTISSSTKKEGLRNLKLENYRSIRLIYIGSFTASKTKYKRLIKFLKANKDV